MTEKNKIEERKPYWDLVDKKAESNNRIDLDAYAKGVEDGVKWHEERSYSEEEVLELLISFHFLDENVYEWFNLNKKKTKEE